MTDWSETFIIDNLTWNLNKTKKNLLFINFLYNLFVLFNLTLLKIIENLGLKLGLSNRLLQMDQTTNHCSGIFIFYT